jgi:pimeloyl-ACP methyl ester carboxylesterase
MSATEQLAKRALLVARSSNLEAASTMKKLSYRISRLGAPSLSLHEWGEGEPIFLLIHGFGDGGFIWNELVPSLVPLGRVIAVDLRGHGDSDWDVARCYDAATHLIDMHHLVHALGLSKNIILIGHSLGGEIALRLTLAHPGRISGLIVVDFGPDLDRAATAYIRKEFVEESRTYASLREYATHLAIKLPLISRSISESLAEFSLRLRPQGDYELKRDPAMGNIEPANRNSLPSLWPMLKNIYCPALIVRGIASSVFPVPVAQRMVNLLPDASLALIPLAGHAVMIDNPSEFGTAVLAFLCRILKYYKVDD